MISSGKRTTIVVAVVLLTATASAAPASDALDLGRITVTATRNSVLAIETPAAIDTITLDELRMRRQTRSTPESLGRIPGVMIQRTGHGQGSPYIRGFTGFRTLFLVDGIRLNNSTFRDGPNQYWNTVDAFSIGKLELVKGPVSVLYGSDAIGGTVNAMTPDASDLTDGPLRTGLLYRYSTAEESGVGRIEAAQVFDGDIGLRVGASLKEFGDLHSAAGRQRHSGYPERDIDLKVSVGQDQGTWTIVHQRVAIDDAWRTHKTVFGQSFSGTTTGNEQRRSLNQRRKFSYVRYRHDEIGPVDDLTATVSYHEQDEDRLRVRADDRSDHQGTRVGTAGLALDAGFDGPGRWQFGLEYYRDDVDSFRRDFNADGSLKGPRIQGPVADDARYETSGLFVQNQFSTGSVGWTAGARYTSARARAGKVEDPQSGEQTSVRDSWNALTGSLRAVWRPESASWSVYGGISQGFRAPNLSDLTRFDSARSNEIEVPSTELEAEDFLNYELGIRFDQARLGGQFSAFHTEVENLVARTPTGQVIDGDNVVVKINSAEGHVQGFEAEAHWRLPHDLEVFGTFTWIDGQVLTYPTSEPVALEEPLDRLMPLTVTGGLRWRSALTSRWMELEVVRAERADRLSTRDIGDTQRIPPGGTPAYTVVDLRGGWSLAPGLEVAVAVENLTDKFYRIHGSGVNEAGRNLVITVNWRPGAR